VSASSARRASIAAATRRMAAARSNADRAAHPGKAAPAASTARRASSLVPSGTVPIGLPVDGLVASSTAPLSDATHRPPTNMPCRSPIGPPQTRRGRPLDRPRAPACRYSTGISSWTARRSIPWRLR
jgi:hypothetical protein